MPKPQYSGKNNVASKVVDEEEKQFDDYLLSIARQVDATDRIERKQPKRLSKAQAKVARETQLRDAAALMILLGAGQDSPDISFMFGSEPDGSRIPQLESLLDRIEWLGSPAFRLAMSPSLVDEIVADCRLLGVVGERELVIALYIVGVSRLLERPLSAIVRGSSSTGKSFLVKQVSSLFPPEQMLNATKMTPQALYHLPTLEHKFVVAGERSRVQDDAAADATGALRQLQSEGYISKATTESVDGKWTTRLVEQRGPISYVETTTLKPGNIFSEDLNRCLLLTTNDSEAHTREILAKTAARYSEEKVSHDTSGVIDKHRQFQLSLERCRVIIPFAGKLVELIPAKKVEARRVAQQVLSTIEAVAILHQHQRGRDRSGCLVAEMGDYEIAREVLKNPLGESLGVKPAAASLYAKLAQQFPGGKSFTTTQATPENGADRTVRGWLNELQQNGCLKLLKAGSGTNPATWQLTAKQPGDSVLPPVEALAGLSAKGG